MGYKMAVILIKYTAYIKTIIHNKHWKLLVAKGENKIEGKKELCTNNLLVHLDFMLIVMFVGDGINPTIRVFLLYRL